jgi:hypothetical protein
MDIHEDEYWFLEYSNGSQVGGDLFRFPQLMDNVLEGEEQS